MDWRGACIVPLYKGKGDKYECSISRGISLLSVVGTLYDRVLIKRVRAGTECAIGEEQCEFRQGRGYLDQVFAVRQVCKKYLANGKDVFWAFMDLEKVYDTIDRHGRWQMLRVHGVGGKLFKGVQSFYIDNRACLYEGVIVPTALYGAEAWGMRSCERRKVNVLEMKCLRSLVGVS